MRRWQHLCDDDDFRTKEMQMGAYLAWTIAALLVLAGFVLLIIVPGVGVLALLALAVGIVLAAVMAISYGGSRRAMQSDVEERREEHVERQHDQRRGAR